MQTTRRLSTPTAPLPMSLSYFVTARDLILKHDPRGINGQAFTDSEVEDMRGAMHSGITPELFVEVTLLARHAHRLNARQMECVS